MPDHFSDRFEREVAYNAPAWLRLEWALWEARSTERVWLLRGSEGYATSPSAKRTGLVVFPSLSVAQDAALPGLESVSVELADLAHVAVSGTVEVWPAYQSSYHGGVELPVTRFIERALAAMNDVRSQLEAGPDAFGFWGFEPIQGLKDIVALPDQAPKLPKPKPAGQVRGVFGSPARNRFKYMHSNVLWLAATGDGPLGAVIPGHGTALAAWPAPEFMTPLEQRSDFVAVRVGWGEDLLRPLVERGVWVLAAANESDGLLCPPAWFAMPDLASIDRKR